MVLQGSQLLLSEETGGLWRLRADGSLARMPDPVSGEAPVRPTYLLTGPSGVLLAYGTDAAGRSAVLSSPDGGAHWDVYVPA